MLTVHVRVNDLATNKPAALRVRFLDEQGQLHVPFGRRAEFAEQSGMEVGGQVRLGAERFVYIDGACEVRLPPGSIFVEGTKGPEYSPLRRQVTLGPGQIALRLGIERWVDQRAEGWYSGDTRVLSLTPHAALLEAAAEDLAVVNLLAEALPDLLAFSGTLPALAAPGHLVVVNTLNSHPVLGTVSLLNCHRPVYPLRFGAPEADAWSVADWCDQCHRKRGLVVWPDLPRLQLDALQGEALAALILRKIDAYEISAFPDLEPATLQDWYRLLDCGLRIPLVGGSGKNSNTIAIGAVRTYAHLEPDTEFTYAAWIEAVRNGRTFATNGPLLTLTVEDALPGSVLSLPDGGRRVKIRAEVRSAAALDQLEIISNGKVVASQSVSGVRQATVLELEADLSVSGWLAARCWSRERLPDGQVAFAHTSPVYVLVGNRSPRPSQETVNPLLTVLAQTSQWIQEQARCPLESQRTHLLGVTEAARQELTRRINL